MRELTFAAEQFLIHEAELLDDGRFEDWLALFDEDAWYWAPVLAEATERGLTPAHYDEDRTQMEARVRRLRQPNAWSEHPPTRCCRMVSNVRIAAQNGRELEVSSRLTVHVYRSRVTGEDSRRTFAARVRHLLRPAEDSYRIGWKRVDLVDAEGAFEVTSVPL